MLPQYGYLVSMGSSFQRNLVRVFLTAARIRSLTPPQAKRFDGGFSEAMPVQGAVLKLHL